MLFLLRQFPYGAWGELCFAPFSLIHLTWNERLSGLLFFSYKTCNPMINHGTVSLSNSRVLSMTVFQPGDIQFQLWDHLSSSSHYTSLSVSQVMHLSELLEDIKLHVRLSLHSLLASSGLSFWSSFPFTNLNNSSVFGYYHWAHHLGYLAKPIKQWKYWFAISWSITRL